MYSSMLSLSGGLIARRAAAGILAGSSSSLVRPGVAMIPNTIVPMFGMTAPVAPFTMEVQKNAKGVAKKESMMMQQKLNMVVATVGQIVDPYAPIPGRFLPPIYTVDGLKSRWNKMKKFLQSAAGVALIMKNDRQFRPKKFHTEAEKLYREINETFALGDRGDLRDLVTENAYTGMKRGIKDRSANEVHRLEIKSVDLVKMVSCRAVQIQNLNEIFAQVTCHIEAKQTFAVFDKRGNLMRGDPTKVIPVSEFWVFEKGVKSGPASKWRFAGKINEKLYPPLALLKAAKKPELIAEPTAAPAAPATAEKSGPKSGKRN